MARQVTEEFGNERRRYSVFTAALRETEPGETIAVGISILDVGHILSGEKTGYGQAFIRIHDPEWNALLAEEYEIAGDGSDVEKAVADAVASATERFLRLRTEHYEQVDAERLPEETY